MGEVSSCAGARDPLPGTPILSNNHNPNDP